MTEEMIGREFRINFLNDWYRFKVSPNRIKLLDGKVQKFPKKSNRNK